MSEEISSIDILEKTFARLLMWINAADSKISTILAIDTSMLAIFAALASQLKTWSTRLIIHAVFTLILLLISLVFLCVSAFPRTRGPKKSLLYFGSIANMKFGDYLDHGKKITPEIYIEDLASQCHRNAEIADLKYKYIKLAMLFLFITIIPWLLLVYTLLV